MILTKIFVELKKKSSVQNTTVSPSSRYRVSVERRRKRRVGVRYEGGDGGIMDPDVYPSTENGAGRLKK